MTSRGGSPRRRPRPAARRRGPSAWSLALRGAGRLLLRLAVLLVLVALLMHATGAWEALQKRYRSAGPEATPYAQLFRAAASRYPEVSAAQLAAQARAESDFDPSAVSPAGAQGLMQIVPATFRDHRVDGDGDGRRDPFVAADSIFTAAAYLTWIGEQLHLPVSDARVIAAYNAGPSAVQRAGGVPDFPETRTYVERVQRWTPDYRWLDTPSGRALP